MRKTSRKTSKRRSKDVKNRKCKFNSADKEKENIKKCTILSVNNINNVKLKKGRMGLIYLVDVKTKGDKNKFVILKKISGKVKTKKEANNFIADTKKEIDYGIKMAEYEMGPRIYDAFFIINNENIITQYILMEKYDMSVGDWIADKKTTFNDFDCDFIVNSMLNILYKQIFQLGMYCSDIKVDNYVMNVMPLEIKMIDFGKEWCDKTFPDEYSLRGIKKYKKSKKQKIFYSLCVLQLFMNIVHIRPSAKVFEKLLKPFYSDKIFYKYVLNNDKIKYILKDILDSGTKQGITLRYYMCKNENQTSNEIIDYVFGIIDKITERIII